jgi:hypothetical protein
MAIPVPRNHGWIPLDSDLEESEHWDGVASDNDDDECQFNFGV